MFEGWVYQLVAGYLGNYIKDIHREQFRVGLWSGVALLENAELRLEAFDYLQLPFAIKQGFVGKLRLQVPWTTLFWEPILIVLEDVYICACPRDDSEWNAEASENRALAAKKAKLAAAEIAKLSSHVPGEIQSLLDEKVRQSFLSHLLAKIIDNIQVTIRNIHIRYVDGRNHSEGAFDFGVKLAGLTVATTDGRGYAAAGSSAASKSKSSLVHKSVEINQFAVYWNSTSSTSTVPRQLNSTIGHYLTRWFVKKDDLAYLLYPMDASLKLTVNRSAASEGGGPQYALAASMDKLDVNLGDRQLYEMFLLWEFIKISRQRERYGRFRPRVGRSRQERECCHWQSLWWQYAIKAVASDVQKRLRQSSWRYLGWRLDCRRRYVSLYKSKLECFREGKPPDSGINTELEELEKELDMDTILCFRSLAENKCQSEGGFVASDISSLPPEPNRKSTLEDHDNIRSNQNQGGWLRVLSFGMLGGSGSMDAAAEFTGPLSDEIMKDLYEATNFHPTAIPNGEGSKGYNLMTISLQLKEAFARMENSYTKHGLVGVTIKGIYAGFRKLQDVANAAVAFKTFEVKDICTQDSYFPHLVVPKGLSSKYAPSKRKSYAEAAYGAQRSNLFQNQISQRELNEAVFRIDIELSEDPNWKIVVVIKPLEIVYSPPVVEALLNFFKLPSSYQIDEGHTSLDMFQTQPYWTRLTLTVDVRDPVLVIPESSTAPNCAIIVVCLQSLYLAASEFHGVMGYLNRSVHGNVEISELQAKLSNLLLDLPRNTSALEHFEVKLTGLQVAVGEESLDLDDSLPSWSNVIDNFNVQMNITKYKCSSVTHWKIDVSSTAIRVAISAANCRALRAVLRSANSLEHPEFHPVLGDSSSPPLSTGVPNLISGHFSVRTVDVAISLSEAPSAALKAISFHIEQLVLKFSKDRLQEELALSMEKLLMESLDVPGDCPRRCLCSVNADACANALSFNVVRRWNDELSSLRLLLLLQSAEFHVYPKIVGAVVGFVSSIFDQEEPAHQNAETAFSSSISAIRTENLEAPFSLTLQLDNVSFSLHDSYGVLATLALPESRFLLSSSAVTFETWEIEGNATNLQLTGPEFATRDIDGIPFTSLSHGPPSTVHLRLVKRGALLPALEIFAGLESVECILQSDYLALLIGFFRSSEWKYAFPMQTATTTAELAQPETIVQYEVEVKKSLLLLPTGGGNLTKIFIPEFSFSFIPLELRGAWKDSPSWQAEMGSGDNGCKAFYIRGRQLSLSTYGLDAGSGKDRCWLPLIDRLDGEILVELPNSTESCGNNSPTTNIHLKFPVIDLSLTGNAFLRQIQRIEFVSNELALVGKKSSHANMIRESFATGKEFSGDTGEGDKESDSSLSLRCYMDQFSCSIKSSKEGDPWTVETIMIGQATSLSAIWIVTKGLFESFTMNLMNITLSDGSHSSTTLDREQKRTPDFEVMLGDAIRIHTQGKLLMGVTSEAMDLNLKVVPLPSFPARKQIEIVFPYVEVWLHFASWNRIFSWIFVCFPVLPAPASQNDNATDFLQDVDDSLAACAASNTSPLGASQNGAASRVRAGISNVELLLPDFTAVNQTASLERHADQTKIILFTSSFYLDKFELIGSKCIFSAHLTQVKAETRERQLSRYPCLLTDNVKIKGEIDLELPVPALAIAADVDSIDCWCSFPVLQFLNTFKVEPSDHEDSLGLELRFRLKVDIGSASLLLTDGRWNYNCPLLEIILGETSGEISWAAADMEVLLSTLTEISYHNIQKVVWEPFLEPWRVSVVIMRGYEPVATAFSTKMEVMSSSNLNINFTEAFSQAAARAIEMISWSSFGEDQRYDLERSSHNKQTNFSQYAPYWFQNDTGMAVSYSLIWPSWNDEIGTGKEQLSDSFGTSNWRTILPGCSVPLFVNENEGLIHRRKARWISSRVSERKKIGLMSHRRMRVQLEGTSGPSLPMSIDLVGCRAFEVVFSNLEGGREGDRHTSQGIQNDIDHQDQNNVFATHAVFEVSLQHHSKLIRLHSTVAVANSTSVTLEVRLEIPFGIAPKVMDPILPDEVIPLPLHLAETGRIRWRPFGKDYLWSEAQSLSKMISAGHKSSSQRPVVCYPSRPSNGTFRCCISVEEKPVSAAVATREQLMRWKMWKILLQAPFVIKNGLPCSMEVEIGSGAGVNVHLVIPKGDSVFVYEVDVVHDLSLKIIISEFLPNSVKFGRAASRNRTERRDKISRDEILVFNPENSSGRPVYARVDKVTDFMSGAREISISVPYWIYNCSGLDLVFSDGDVDLHNGKEQFLPEAYCHRGNISSTVYQGLQSLLETGNAYNACLIRKQPGKVVSHLPSCKVFKLLGPATNSSRPPPSPPPPSTTEITAENDQADTPLPQAHLYSPSKVVEVSEHKMRLRVFQHLDSTAASWSQAFLLDPPGGTSPIIIPQPDSRGAYVLSVTSAPAMGTCSGRTKTITFRPRFVLENASRQEISFKQQGTNVIHHLPVGESVHLHWTDSTRNLLILVRYNQHGWDWSGGFAPDRLGDTQVKVHNHLSGTKEILRVEVSNAGANSISSENEGLGTFYIIVTNDETGFMPYRIDNFSLGRLRFYQKRCEKTENILQPYSSCDYAWDEPCLPPQLVIEVPGEGALGAYELDNVRSYPTIQFHGSGQKSERRFVVSVHAEGARRVLSVIDMTLHAQKDPKMLLTPRVREKFTDSVQSHESVSEEFSLKLACIGISLVDSTPQELVYASAREVSCQFIQSHQQQKVKMEITVLQVDNQLRHATYPVVLSTANYFQKLSSVSGIVMKDIISSEWKPSPMPTSETIESPAVALLVSKWRHPTGSVDCFQYIYLSIAPLQLELEERNLTRLLGFLKGLSVGGSNMGAEKSMSFKVQPLLASNACVPSGIPTNLIFVEMIDSSQAYRTWPVPAAVEPVKVPTHVFSKQKRKVYIEAFHIDPLELTVSFSSVPWLPKDSREVSILWVMGSVLQRRLIALADVEGAPIRLRQLTLAHPMANWNAVLGIIQRHYTRQLFHEVYKVLGSAGLFGNPMSFMRSLGSGMWDFVSAPARSVRQNPGDIIQGVSLGTRSLFRNTVFAFSNAATQMSKAARKGMAPFALDQDYINELEIYHHGHLSRDSSIVNEFLEGLTGLLQSSVRGAERHGIPGVFTGMAVGVLRAIARPAASMLEVAGKTAQSIRNSSRPAQPRITRLRLPRHLEQGSPLLPYSWNEAVGTAVLLEADGGRLKDEVYVTCQELSERGVFVLLTENLLLQVKRTSQEELEASGDEWSIMSEDSVEDILYIDRDDKTLDVLFCTPNVLLKGSRHRGVAYRFVLSPFKNVTLHLNSSECTDELHSTLLHVLNHRQSARWTGAAINRITLDV